MGIDAGDDVFVNDGEEVVGYVRRASLRELVVFIEDHGDFVLPRSSVTATGNNFVVLGCQSLPLRMRAVIGHLHGESYDPDA